MIQRKLFSSFGFKESVFFCDLLSSIQLFFLHRVETPVFIQVYFSPQALSQHLTLLTPDESLMSGKGICHAGLDLPFFSILIIFLFFPKKKKKMPIYIFCGEGIFIISNIFYHLFN